MKNKLYLFFSIIFCIATLFMGVGYASINSISLNILGKMNTKVQEELFITEVNYNEELSNNVLVTDSKINSSYQTNFNSSIVLSNSTDSQITYDITIYNSNDVDYYFDDVEYTIGEDTYSNENITFRLNNLSYGDIVSAKNDITFSITFYYKNIDVISDVKLNSILNFKFKVNKYVVVNFNGNGGNVNIESKELLFNRPYGELPIPTREGYTFSGWSIEKAGKEFITEENIVNIDSEHTLYAQWNAKSYTVRFNSNGGVGTMINQTIKYDAVVPLSKNNFTKEGYRFFGWAMSTDGEKIYNDMDNVVNLKLDGIVDLYAIWVEDSYTVTFDYNGGVGSVESMQVLYGKTYGALPEYPHSEGKTFTGWYTAKTGGTQILSTNIVNIRDNHTLYAQWESAPYNDAIKNIVIKNIPDQNYDGVMDAIYLNFTCSSSFEKYNIPIKNLVVGQKYKISYVASNNASFGDNEAGYKNSMYGSIITSTASLSSGSIKTEAIAAGGLIAEWEDRSKGDKWLNGPFSKEMVFTAVASTMYWTWDFGLMEDGVLYDFNITDIVLEPVVPTMDFSNKKLILYSTSTAKVLNDVSSSYSSDFTFDGDSYAETLYYPITGLTSGSTYTITFEHLYNGYLIDDSATASTMRYDYGTGIMGEVPSKYGSFMTTIGTYASNTFIKKTVTGTVDTVTLTFTATNSTMYWVWNMANCSDTYNNKISIKVTKFSANHNGGGQITYYSG